MVLILNLHSSTTMQHNYSDVVGVLFSMPTLARDVASMMALGHLLVVETRKRRKSLTKILPWITRYSNIVEWVVFSICLGVPVSSTRLF